MLHVRLARFPRLWPTPTTQDAKNNAGPAQHGRKSKPLNVVASELPEGSSHRPPAVVSGRGGSSSIPLLNPVFVETLMGLTEDWTRIDIDDGG